MSFFFSTKDLWKSLEKLDGIVKEVTTTWQTNNIDVVIAPGFAFPAPPLKHPARLVPASSYTSVYNVMDFPAGSVPVTRVISEDEVIYFVIMYGIRTHSNLAICEVIYSESEYVFKRLHISFHKNQNLQGLVPGDSEE